MTCRLFWSAQVRPCPAASPCPSTHPAPSAPLANPATPGLDQDRGPHRCGTARRPEVDRYHLLGR
jgi:hypothetical protein